MSAARDEGLRSEETGDCRLRDVSRTIPGSGVVPVQFGRFSEPAIPAVVSSALRVGTMRLDQQAGRRVEPGAAP